MINKSTNQTQALAPDFSVYRLFNATTPVDIFTERRRQLARWCATIEEAVIEQPAKLTIFAAFQELRYFFPVAKRYLRMADRGHTIYAFGEPTDNLPVHQNLHFVYLQPYDALRKEWFLVANTAAYSRALLALEVTPSGTPHRDRTYTGTLTSNSTLVEKAYLQLMQQVGLASV